MRIVLFFVFFCFCSSSLITNAESGADKYVPTKLEWLALETRSIVGTINDLSKGYTVFIDPKPPDTIVILAVYSEHPDLKGMNQVVKNIKKIVESKARMRGWTWLKIEEKMQMLEN